MKRVIIWGAGRCGEYTSRFLNKYSSNIYNVVGVADKYASEYKKKGKDILSAAEVKEMVDNGHVDGVIIAISNDEEYLKTEEFLNSIGCNVLALDSRGYIFASEAAKRSIVTKNDIRIYDIRNVVVASIFPFEGAFKYPYIVLKDNQLLWESDRSITSRNLPAYKYPAPSSRSDCKKVDKAFYLLGIGKDFNYGHFTMTTPGIIFVAETTGYDGKYMLYDTDFAHRWSEILCLLLNIDENRFVWISPKKDVFIEVRELFLTDNYQDSSLVMAKNNKAFVNKLVEWNRKHFENKSFFSVSKKPLCVYINRKGVRRLLGCETIINRYGFIEIFPEEYDICDQIRIFYEADIVLCPHGANATGCLFMREGSHFIETFGAGFIDLFYLETMRHNRVHFHMLVEAKENGERGIHEDYMINPTLLEMKIIDCMTEYNKMSENHERL